MRAGYPYDLRSFVGTKKKTSVGLKILMLDVQYNPVGFSGTCKLSILDENPLGLLQMAVVVFQAQQGGHQRIICLQNSRLHIYSRETVHLTHFLTNEPSQKRQNAWFKKKTPSQSLSDFYQRNFFPISGIPVCDGHK